MSLPTIITPIKAFTDNYIWAIHNSDYLALVDPGDARVCIEFIELHQLCLTELLITHHHADHTGGINDLVSYCQQKGWPIKVYGPANESIPHCQNKLIENDMINLPLLNMTFNIIDLPGHTAGHIAYYSAEEKMPILFCGDTLFSAGCGRIFEGSPSQMLTSLTKLANLPEHTQVYCTHEYTQANIKFALTVDPQNQDLLTYSNEVNELRKNNISTIPTTIKVEKQINPFLRSNMSAIQYSAKMYDANTKATNIDVFTTIRRWKDQF